MTKPGDSDPADGAEDGTEDATRGSAGVARPKRERPVMPTAREAAAEQGDKPVPTTLRASFYLFVAAGVLWVFGAVMDRLNLDAYVEREIEYNRQNDTDLTDQQIHDIVDQAIWVMLVLGVIFGVFLALFGYKATHGVRRARTLVTIFATITALFHVFFNGTIVGLTIALAALVGIVLLHLPSSRAHFPSYRG